MPRDRAGRGTRPAKAKRIDWTKYAKGTTGGSGDVPRECQAKPDTGSADDMWLRNKLTEPTIPEDIFVPSTNALPDPQPVNEYGG